MYCVHTKNIFSEHHKKQRVTLGVRRVTICHLLGALGDDKFSVQNAPFINASEAFSQMGFSEKLHCALIGYALWLEYKIICYGTGNNYTKKFSLFLGTKWTFP